ncbi:hypothetical protein L6R50_02250 [Myxococcota bacterium]|nr:hypothetical protein [Myxococcota bacterium]
MAGRSGAREPKGGGQGRRTGATGAAGLEHECPWCDTWHPLEDVPRLGETIYCLGCGCGLKVLRFEGRRVRVRSDD